MLGVFPGGCGMSEGCPISPCLPFIPSEVKNDLSKGLVAFVSVTWQSHTG